MPELPEVETIAQELIQENLVGTSIVEVEVLHPQILEGVSPEELKKRLQTQRIQSITRRGKYLILELTKDRLLIHLRMTGKLFFNPPSEKHLKHVHLKIHLDDGRILYFEDPRRFGRWYLGAFTNEKLEALGIEPLSCEFSPAALQALLKSHAMQIKPFLLNQRFIAGLGNIYVDEALWEAKIHPQTNTQKITKAKTVLLHEAIQNVLKRGIANQGTTLGKYSSNYLSVSGKRGDNQEGLKVFRREGLLCPRCGNKIIKMTVAQRGTHICPVCQR